MNEFVTRIDRLINDEAIIDRIQDRCADIKCADCIGWTKHGTCIIVEIHEFVERAKDNRYVQQLLWAD